MQTTSHTKSLWVAYWRCRQGRCTAECIAPALPKFRSGACPSSVGFQVCLQAELEQTQVPLKRGTEDVNALTTEVITLYQGWCL